MIEIVADIAPSQLKSCRREARCMARPIISFGIGASDE